MGVLLFVIAFYLLIVMLIPGIVHVVIGAFRGRGGWAYINSSFMSAALAIDVAGNVVFSTLLNDWFVKKGAWLYGSPGQTISGVTGINYLTNKLNWVGMGLCATLNIVDFKSWNKGGHCYVAAMNDFVSNTMRFRDSAEFQDILTNNSPPIWRKDILWAIPFNIICFTLLYTSTKLLLWLI